MCKIFNKLEGHEFKHIYIRTHTVSLENGHASNMRYCTSTVSPSRLPAKTDERDAPRQ